MLILFAMMFAFSATITFFEVEMPGGWVTLVALFLFVLVVQAILNKITNKVGIKLPSHIKSRGIETLFLVIIYSFINGLLILAFSQFTNLLTFNNLYEPFIVAGSMLLIRQLFE
jgi:hypothetical protein